MNGGGVETIIINIADAVPAFRGILELFALLLGLIYFIQAANDAILLSKGRQGHMMGQHVMPMGLISKVIIGSLLVGFGLSVETVVNTVSTDFTTYDVLTNQTVNEYGKFNKLLTALLRIVQVIGMIGILRGFVLFKSASDSGGHQGGGVGKAFILTLGGAVAVNLLYFVKMFEETSNMNIGSLLGF